METQVQVHLDKFVAVFKAELKDNLVGIYLHGSLAMGCFNPCRSDVDLIVVIKDKMTVENNKRIARTVLSLHDEMRRGLEFSIILETYLTSFVYPTPCEFHYSEYHHEKYKADENYVCGAYEDFDLASQITAAYYRGITLYGNPLKQLYKPSEKSYYLASILHDVEGATKEIIDSPMYITLNLCRVLFFIRHGNISSKREGGEWGIRNVPSEFKDLVRLYLNEYNGMKVSGQIGNEQLTSFADYMLDQIKGAMNHNPLSKTANNDVTIECKDIILREYKIEDLDEFHAISMQPEIIEFLPDWNVSKAQRLDWLKNYEIKENSQFLKAASEGGEVEQLRLRLAMILKETGEFIGWCCTGIKEELPAPNR